MQKSKRNPFFAISLAPKISLAFLIVAHGTLVFASSVIPRDAALENIDHTISFVRKNMNDRVAVRSWQASVGIGEEKCW